MQRTEKKLRSERIEVEGNEQFSQSLRNKIEQNNKRDEEIQSGLKQLEILKCLKTEQAEYVKWQEKLEHDKQNLEIQKQENDTKWRKIQNEIIQEVIDDVMSLTKSEVDEQRLWEEIKTFQKSWKTLEEGPTKRINWYNKYSICKAGLERKESNAQQLKVLYEDKKKISKSLGLEGESKKLEQLKALKKTVISQIRQMEEDIGNIELWQRWEEQIKHERKTLEQDGVIFCKMKAITTYDALKKQAIEIKNKCFEYNQMVSNAQPQEKQEKKYSKLIHFKDKSQPQELDNKKWTSTTQYISLESKYI